jgi:putative transposase
MANSMLTPGELLDKLLADERSDLLKEAVLAVTRQLMELEVEAKTGAAHGERSLERLTQRNGYRPRRWDTRVGSLELAIPKLRQGSYFPSFLEPRRRSEEALFAVVAEAYVHGVSTRKVEELAAALGIASLSKSEVSRICTSLDERVTAFRCRPLVGRYPYLWLDARYEKVRDEAGRVVSMALVVAIGVAESGEREVLGFDVAPSEDLAFWKAFLGSLVDRGLEGVQLVVSDAHRGLQRAIEETFLGASWQRCRVHFLRNLLALIPREAQGMALAAVRFIFAQPDAAAAHAQLRAVAEGLGERFPRAAAALLEAEEEILAHMAFPHAHWSRISSTNPLERLNKEIARRTNVVGIFPHRESLIRLAGALLAEQSDEWAVGRRYLSQGSLAGLYAEADADHGELTYALALPVH